jgi:hypothetical protein
MISYLTEGVMVLPPRLLREYGSQGRKAEMRRWTFWEWLAYACLLVGAMILAADTALKIAPDLAQKVPGWVGSPLWGFAPLALMLIATVILIASNSGLLAVFSPRRPIKLFLERDSGSNLYGVQTFPSISYIQISATASRHIEKCRAWITKVDYDVGGGLFALEHNERFPCGWSKPKGSDRFVQEIIPGEPPVRLTILVFNKDGIAHDLETPTNLFPKLQQIGVHRLEITLTGSYRDKTFSKIVSLLVDWRGPSEGAFVRLDLE